MTRYALGVDLGTTYSAAAVARGSTVDVCTLGTTAPQVPSVVLVREDGTVLTGEAAERRAPSEPARTAREFKRRLGDPVPLIVGGTPYGAEALAAHLLRAIVEQVTTREGARPDLVVLTHPANYTDYKRGMVEEVARLAGLDASRVRLLTEPQAAAIAYAAQERFEPGTVVAIYDFGGGTFDAAVIRRTEAGFELVGTPEGMERLGGIDFDQAVLAHVDSSLDGMVSGADPTAEGVLAGLSRVRDEARRAKEALSADTDASVMVSLPGLQTEVRLTREELESMVRPRVAETVAALERSIRSAGLTLDDVSRVLLVGGSSRMPIIADEVRRATGRPVTADAHPKFAIATGAALMGAGLLADEPAPPLAASAHAAAAGAAAAALTAVESIGSPTAAATAPGTTPPGPTGRPVPGVGPTGTPLPLPGPPPEPHPPTPASEPVRPRRRKKGRLVAAGIAVVAVVAVVGVVVSSGGGGKATPPASSSAPAAAVTTAGSRAGDSTTTIASAAGGRGLDGVVTAVAGNGNDDGLGRPGPAIAASLGSSARFAVAPNGDLFVVDHENELLLVSGDQLRVVYKADTAIGESGFGGVTVGPDGDAYVSMGTGVKRIRRDGSNELVFDAAAHGRRSTFGPVTFDGAGNLYVFENAGFRVLRMASGGGLSVVAGTGSPARIGSPPDGDGGPATAATLTAAAAMVVDAQGGLLFAESGRPLLRRVAPDGTISTVAGGGTTPLAASGRYAPDGTKATALTLEEVAGVAVDASGRIYLSDSAAHAIVRFGRDRALVLLAGDHPGAVPDVGRAANEFQVRSVSSVAVESTGGLLFAQDDRILRMADATK